MCPLTSVQRNIFLDIELICIWKFSGKAQLEQNNNKEKVVFPKTFKPNFAFACGIYSSFEGLVF